LAGFIFPQNSRKNRDRIGFTGNGEMELQMTDVSVFKERYNLTENGDIFQVVQHGY
jgi:hypothetical protein